MQRVRGVSVLTVHKRAPLLAACAVLIAGCARQLPLALPANTPAQVFQLGGAHYTLDPASAGYRSLDQWVSNNRSGWSWGHYYATPPTKGVIVRAGNLNLQFLDSTVLAHTPQGDYRKNAPPSEYAFLVRKAGGT
jgi:hypothetical protein